MTDHSVSSSLFGLMHSNRDFSQNRAWGKNQFNTSFPTSLACYMDSIGLKPIYLRLDSKLNVAHDTIAIEEIFGLKPLSSNLYFAFESDFTPYRTFVIGALPRIDLVTMDTSEAQNQCLRGIEIKLTALPDNQTCDLKEDQFGCEVVVRPDTIVYLALSVAMTYRQSKRELRAYLEPVCGMKIDWTNIEEVAPVIPQLINCLDKVLVFRISNQKPFLLQPVWKTIGKALRLAKSCFDAFLWSDFAFTRLFMDAAKQQNRRSSMSRHMRTVVWLAMMLYEFSIKGKIDYQNIIDRLTYNTKNDKAFSCGGQVTYPYMRCIYLTKPRVLRTAVKQIILGGGEKYLSPERRLDGAILSTPGLF